MIGNPSAGASCDSAVRPFSCARRVELPSRHALLRRGQSEEALLEGLKNRLDLWIRLLERADSLLRGLKLLNQRRGWFRVAPGRGEHCRVPRIERLFCFDSLGLAALDQRPGLLAAVFEYRHRRGLLLLVEWHSFRSPLVTAELRDPLANVKLPFVRVAGDRAARLGWMRPSSQGIANWRIGIRYDPYLPTGSPFHRMLLGVKLFLHEPQ